MSGQSRWWAIPGALLVLTGVLVVAESQRAPEAGSQPVSGSNRDAGSDRDGDAGGLRDLVMARDASGQRKPLAFGDALVGQALILVMPEHFAGKNVDVTLWRRIGEQREAEPWIEMQPLVRSDATLPMAGIVPGVYDIEVGLPNEPHWLVEAAAAPGEVSFVAATPVR